MARMVRPSGWSSRLISNEQLVISNRPTRSVIPSAVEESPRSRQGQQRIQHAHSEEILRYTQDDRKNGRLPRLKPRNDDNRHPEERSDVGIYLCEGAENVKEIATAKASQ